MQTNFDFLVQTDRFKDFAMQAAEAERSIAISPSTAAILSRRALELAVRWVYVHDDALTMPYRDNISSLIHEYSFRKLIQPKLFDMLKYTIKLGNVAVHTNTNVKHDAAVLSLRCVFQFCKWIDYCYGENYINRHYDMSLLPDAGKEKKTQEELENLQKELSGKDQKLEEAIKENEKLREEMTKLRKENETGRSYEVDKDTEAETRRKYIDLDLAEAGWTIGKDCLTEVPVTGMPNSTGKGYADYVLYSNNGKPLAVIEAKRSSVDPMKGSHQAKLYADCLENQYQQRPIIFITNGFEMQIIDDAQDDPQRVVSGIFTKEDLQRMVDQRTSKKPLIHLEIQDKITNRPYQKEAVTVLCESIMNHHRKLLLVQATGSGKTRVSISLVDVLRRHNYVKNILFLADRKALVSQAKKSYSNLLPDLTVCNLLENKEDPESSRMIFSTYPTMLNAIDETKKKDGKKLFTPAHFDLIIVDESHRSIYKKYQEIFHYFDAVLLGMTATPKDEIDKNTYNVFELDNGVPTYGYDLAQAVKDGYLVDYVSVESKLKFIEQGIVYDELSEEDKEEYERTFTEEDGNLPDSISSSALNTWIFNEDTIKQVLHILMEHAIKIDYGQKLGKTILFAKNHKHAETIFEIFEKEYPHLKGYAKVIDNRTTYVQSAIDEFSDPKKMPQIAISVDMLDTGIDVPEVLNLVFFKKVMSKAKFWQMIGRGTRLCQGLIDGEDKKKFYIFDFCGNFEFFRMNQGKATANMIALQGAIFNLKFEISYKLQDIEYQTDRLIAYRKALVEQMSEKVRELKKDNFAVRQHLKYVELYSDKTNYQGITYEDTLIVREEVAPLLIPDADEASAVRFDALMYGIELAYLIGKKYTRARGDLMKKVKGIAGVANIPEIQAQADYIQKILHTSYVDDAGINEFEEIRERLRDLMKYVSKDVVPYNTNFQDELLSINWKESELENDDLKKYKEKAEYYIRQHQDTLAIAKLKTNQPLTTTDIASLEKILWKEVGTKQDYEQEIGTKPLGEFVREIVGLDMNAAKEAFSEYLNSTSLDSRQIYFVNQIVEYIVHNGMMKDLSVLQESPFTDQGSVVEIFTDLTVWMGIRKVIDTINANAAA